MENISLEGIVPSNFVHLHLHTQYSLLDGASNISRMISKAVSLGMPAIAMTDHGNMFGVPYFVKEAEAAGIKPIIGCEVYLAKGSRFERKKTAGKQYYHLILLAKNKTGYHNLAKLVSRSFLEGFYYKPRIDKELLEEFSEGLIVSSACLGGEIPQLILEDKLEEAQTAIEWYKGIFGEDFYLELQNHFLPGQQKVNPVLRSLAKKNGIKLIATNDVHFIDRKDREAHTILIKLSTGTTIDVTDDLHYTGEEFLKSEEEMIELFPEDAEAVYNTLEIANKVEEYDIFRDVILPVFELPENFTDQKEYLRYLTFKGAKEKYGIITDEIQERLEHELGIIEDMEFVGYFLIVQDFIRAAKEMGVRVGPGRGSAAGSAVAYAIDITNIDPIKYGLLFERFLNPQRVTMPDVDIDFDDEGREKVLQYVVDKYGKDHVAQLITFGTMGPKTAIRDVARVLRMPISEADKLAKMVPDKAASSFEEAYKESKELREVKEKGTEEQRKVLELAETLEGSVRHTGKHACGIIIGPDVLEEHIPLATAKDAELMVTQYDGKYIESVGMLKMDFLGLKTLSIINDALEIIEDQYGIQLDIDNIPLDDEKTFKIFQDGNTNAIFQFESAGMQKSLKELKPTTFEDLVAMNSLYRPGPMDYIPLYIKRKHGLEEVKSLHPSLDSIVESTYGIMVYQEQIMKAAQVMAGYSLGGADLLRRAMGKKNMEIMEENKRLFVEGSVANGIDEKEAAKVFDVIKEFAKYGFNRSHSAAYALVAFQTAYLKAHYPPALLAATLTHNLKELEKITFYINEAQRMDIPVLGPDINESNMKFTVNKKGEIRFGLVAVKNVGEKAVQSIIDERKRGGEFTSFFDFVKRINLKAVNKRSIESLAKAGAFDSFSLHRAQYFHKENESSPMFLEIAMRYGNQYQAEQKSLQNSLFGDALSELRVDDPTPPQCERWSQSQKLEYEKEVTGFYISGHPLDRYKYVFKHFVNLELSTLKSKKETLVNKTFNVAGMISGVSIRQTKKGDDYGVFTLEDYGQAYDFFLFSEDYLKYRHFLQKGQNIFLTIRVEKSKYNDRINVNIKRILLLSEALDKLLSRIEVTLPLLSIDKEMTSSLYYLIHNNKGEIPVEFKISSTFEKHLSIKMSGDNIGVEPYGFLTALEKQLSLDFILIKK